MDLQSLPSRMKDNQYFRGPDHYGCCSTGLAPVLMKSRDMRRYPDLARGFKFLVGPEVFTDDALRALMIHRKVKGRTYKRDRHTVKFYKAYKSAKAEFTRQVRAIQEANEQAAKKHRELRARAQAGDMQAVAELSNW